MGIQAKLKVLNTNVHYLNVVFCALRNLKYVLVCALNLLLTTEEVIGFTELDGNQNSQNLIGDSCMTFIQLNTVVESASIMVMNLNDGDTRYSGGSVWSGGTKQARPLLDAEFLVGCFGANSSTIDISSLSQVGANASSFQDQVFMGLSFQYDLGGGNPIHHYDVSISGTKPNIAPSADAGEDLTVTSGTLVTLSGESSFDVDGVITQYSWLRVGGSGRGSNAILSDKNSANPSFIDNSLVAGGPAVTHDFQLTVFDDVGARHSDTVTITIITPPENTTPVANAGDDQTVASGTVVSLSASNSYDPDGNVVGYSWRRIGGSGSSDEAILSVPFSQSPTFTDSSLSSDDSPVTHIFELVVTDNDGASSSEDTVTITITPPEKKAPPKNIAPVANAGDDQTVAFGTVVSLTGSNSYDPDGNVVGYSWHWIGGSGSSHEAILSDASSQSPTFTDSSLSSDDSPVTHIFELVVTDNDGASSSEDTVTITIIPPEKDPYTSIQQIQDNVALFIKSRNTLLIQSQPNLIETVFGDGFSKLESRITDFNGNLNLKIAKKSHLWTSIEAKWARSNMTKEKYVLSTLGGNLWSKENIAMGAMLQLDHMEQTVDDYKTHGSGYLVGPYMVFKIPNQNVFFSSRYLFGESKNYMRAGKEELGKFTTERSLIRFQVEGIYEGSEIIFLPKMSISGTREEQKNFNTIIGQYIPSHKTENISADISLDAVYRKNVTKGEVLIKGGVSASVSKYNHFETFNYPMVKNKNIMTGANIGISMFHENGGKFWISGSISDLNNASYRNAGISFGMSFIF